ncbi:MAG: phosphoribosylanthranilate isomerase [Spirochaetia bacterium]|nr:phosphoribosylanthranilate isomerase [Spirochaetia bacterium]
MIVKICGNHSESDAVMTASFGPDLMGWIFSWKSPRRAHPETAAQIIQIIRGASPEIRHVGVFAGNSVGEILNIVRRCPVLDYLQIVEGSGFVQALGRRIVRPGLERDFFTDRPVTLPVIPVIRPVRPVFEKDLNRYGNVPLFIVDAFDPHRPGGTGKRINPELVQHITLPFLLAGGMTPDNVVEAVSLVPCAGVDVSSGVESSPGKKDREKVRDFIAAARSARAG